MSEITLNLFADLTQRKLVNSDGSQVNLPPFFQGDTLLCTLTVLDRATASSSPTARTDLNIRGLRAGIGPINAAPLSGQFTVQAPDPNNEGDFLTTSQLNYNATPAQIVTAFDTAFASAGWSASCVSPIGGCWLVNLTGVASSPIDFTAVLNTLSPTAFVRIRAYQDGGAWWYEIRLIQAPVAYNEDGFDQGITDPPSTRRVIAGNPGSEGTPATNEIQAVTVPANFSGTFFLEWNFRTSGVLSNVSGPSDMQNALNEMFTDGSTPFSVTNPINGQAYVEFTGALGGVPQNLITVTVDQALLGPPQFSMPLDREELAAQLRTAATYTAPLEIKLEILPAGADPTDMTVVGDIITLCQQAVTIMAEELYEELQAIRTINWLNPPAPKTYVPFSPDQVITGQQHYTTVFGDAEHTSFAIVHNLGTDDISDILVSQNVRPGGKVLGNGTEYTATIDSDNQVTLTFAEPPAANSLSVCITTAGPISAFMAGLHVTIAQVDGLQDELNSLEGEVAVLETLVPTGTLLGNAPGSSGTQNIPIPNGFFIFPNLRIASNFDPSTLLVSGNTAPSTASLPRSPALLPGFETSSITSGSILTSSPTAGEVFQNTGSGALILRGGGGRRSNTLPVKGYAGWDGRYWYLLDRAGATNSFFPADFNLQLFPTLEFDRNLWQAGQNFSLTFTLNFQLLNANCTAQYLLVLEWGKARSTTSPDPTSPNLSRVDWFDAPMLTQRLVLTGLQQSNTFGCVIKRSTTNVMTATKQLQAAIAVADSCPLDPSFGLRARLIHFDVQKDLTVPAVGYVWVGINGITATIG